MSDPAMTCEPIEPNEEAVVLVLSGEYDVASKHQVRSAFESIAEAPKAVVDFSAVTYIDSSVMVELIRLHDARRLGELQRETVVARSANILRLFNIFRLELSFRLSKLWTMPLMGRGIESG